MKVAAWSNRHARSILFLLIALTAGGVLGTLSLPVSLFPHITFPYLRVDMEAGDRPAERMEVEITRPIEESLRSIPGVRTVQSTTSRGSAEVKLFFDWGNDMTSAYLQAQAQVNRELAALPNGTTFEVRQMDPAVFPVIAYSLTSNSRPLTELHDLAQYQLLPVLSTVTGVARIGVDGGAVTEYRVVVDPAKLESHHLAISDITSVLTASNVLTAVGHVEDHYKLYLVLADSQFKSIGEIGQTVIRSSSGGVTLLSDVASIEKSRVPQFIHSTSDGHDCVLINVYQQPAGNTVQIAAAIRNALAVEQKHLPRDVKISSWYDQSDLITASANSVRDSVLIGVALAAVVLLLFLRDWRMTFIAAMTVPVVLGITALVLYALGESFNIMTLGGMAAAVGLIIDDAIVMSEHIVRRLNQKDNNSTAPVQDAADEFTKPLAGSSLSTIVIHIPPVFLVGVFGAFFAALSLSMATSLIISFFVAWLVIPVLAGRFLTTSKEPGKTGRITQASERAYSVLMRFLLAHSWLVLLIILPVIEVGYFAYQGVESGVMPQIDEGGFVIDYVGPPGASIAEMDRLLGKLEKILHDTPEVQTFSRRTGFSLGGDISESNNGDFFVRLKSGSRRPIQEVMDDVQDQVKHNIAGLDIDPAQLMEDLLGDLTGKPEPVVINLFSDDESILTDLAPKVSDALGKIDGISSVENGVVPAGDAIDVHIDRIKASLEGVDPDSLTKMLNDLLAGTVTSQLQEKDKLIDVRVWTPGVMRNTTEDLGRLNLRGPDGHLFPLSRVATFELIPGQPEITRENLKRVVSITARSSRDLGSTIRDVQAMLDRGDVIPAGVRYTLGGQYEQQQAAFHGVLRVIAGAGTLVFLLLLFMYERLRVALAIMLVSVLAIASVFVGLRLTSTQLNISSMMGMVMIVGNVTEVAIFYFSEYDESHDDAAVTDRLINAGNHRLRAITMTTIAAVLALLPLALNLGQGAGMLRPLAIAIITGLIVQLPLVLIVLPATLTLFRFEKSHRRF